MTQKYPELSLQRDYPVATSGVNARIRQQAAEIESTTSQARGNFALLYFYSPFCEYCKEQSNILRFFIEKYRRGSTSNPTGGSLRPMCRAESIYGGWWRCAISSEAGSEPTRRRQRVWRSGPNQHSLKKQGRSVQTPLSASGLTIVTSAAAVNRHFPSMPSERPAWSSRRKNPLAIRRLWLQVKDNALVECFGDPLQHL